MHFPSLLKRHNRVSMRNRWVHKGTVSIISKQVDLVYRSHTDHASDFTNHIPTTLKLLPTTLKAHSKCHIDHIPTKYQPHSSCIPTTYWPDQLVHYYPKVCLKNVSIFYFSSNIITWKFLAFDEAGATGCRNGWSVSYLKYMQCKVLIQIPTCMRTWSQHSMIVCGSERFWTRIVRFEIQSNLAILKSHRTCKIVWNSGLSK